MRKTIWVMATSVAVLVSVVGLKTLADNRKQVTQAPAWHVEADLAQMTTDPALCPCYEPSTAWLEHRCDFLEVVRIREGIVGDVDMAGVTFALAGDHGRDLSTLSTSTLIFTCDPTVTERQKNALDTVIRGIWPQKWNRRIEASAPIAWLEKNGGAEIQVGTSAQMKLYPLLDENGVPLVRRDVKYWNAGHHDGFHLMFGSMSVVAPSYEASAQDASGFTTRISAEGSAKEMTRK